MLDAAPLSKDHYLDLDGGKFAGTSKADLDRLFETLANDPDGNKLVVHFHGGNVSKQEGIAIACRLETNYRSAGAYPVFFVWHSGIGEVLEGTRAKFAKPLLQLARGVLTWSALRSLLKLRARHLVGVAHALHRSATRFATGHSHGVRATLVEEFLRAFFVADFGGQVWYLMKREILDAFDPDENTCGGTAFLAGLKKLWEKGHRPRIILIAHSGGSLYICHFLANAAKHLPDAKFDVIFLAAAVTVDLFQRTLFTHASRIANFRSFALKDSLEREDKLIPFIYPRSLLYFMSGVCEQEDRDANDIGDVPLVGMQRYYTNVRVYQDDDVKAVRSFLQQRKRGVWSVAASDVGLTSNATTHVGLDDNTLTLASIKHIIMNGF